MVQCLVHQTLYLIVVWACLYHCVVSFGKKIQQRCSSCKLLISLVPKTLQLHCNEGLGHCSVCAMFHSMAI